MTFTVMGKCPDTGAVGVGLTTCSINAGRVVPLVRGVLPTLSDRGAVISSQSLVNPMLAYRSFDLLEQGASLAEIESDLKAYDEHLGYRQIGIVTVAGEAWAYTGEKCFPEAAHTIGDGYLVMGNVVHADTVPAMDEAYRQGAGEDLAERLMRTLEAGRDAGGQHLNGEHIPELYCSLAVYDGLHPFPAVDLRVDFDLHAVEKVRRLLTHTREGGDRYYRMFYEEPYNVGEETLAWLFDVAKSQV